MQDQPKRSHRPARPGIIYQLRLPNGAMLTLCEPYEHREIQHWNAIIIINVGSLIQEAVEELNIDEITIEDLPMPEREHTPTANMVAFYHSIGKLQEYIDDVMDCFERVNKENHAFLGVKNKPLDTGACPTQ